MSLTYSKMTNTYIVKGIQVKKGQIKYNINIVTQPDIDNVTTHLKSMY